MCHNWSENEHGTHWRSIHCETAKDRTRFWSGRPTDTVDVCRQGVYVCTVCCKQVRGVGVSEWLTGCLRRGTLLSASNHLSRKVIGNLDREGRKQAVAHTDTRAMHVRTFCIQVRVFYTYGTGMLWVRIWALCWPYCLTKVKARYWYSFGETIQNVSRFWNRCGSHWEVKAVMEYYRINGVAQRRLWAYAAAMGVLQVWVRACYGYRYRHTCGCRR